MDDTNRYRIVLYVAGSEAKAEFAKQNICAILAEEVGEARYVLEVVDILEQPEAADAARILATPTLVRADPPPVRRVIGDLSDRRRVITGLDIKTG